MRFYGSHTGTDEKQRNSQENGTVRKVTAGFHLHSPWRETYLVENWQCETARLKNKVIFFSFQITIILETFIRIMEKVFGTSLRNRVVTLVSEPPLWHLVHLLG